MSNKLCPLFSFNKDKVYPCLRDKCQFWIEYDDDDEDEDEEAEEGTCAITQLSAGIGILKEVIDNLQLNG